MAMLPSQTNPSPRFPSVINAANQDAKDELNRTAVL
jgi:hypothetical protein